MGEKSGRSRTGRNRQRAGKAQGRRITHGVREGGTGKDKESKIRREGKETE